MAEFSVLKVSGRTLLVGGVAVVVLIISSFLIHRAIGGTSTPMRNLVSPFYTPCTKTTCTSGKSAVAPLTTTTAPTTTTTVPSTTTTTTLPASLPLGATAPLSDAAGDGIGQVTVSITRFWSGVTPTFDPEPPGGLAHALQFVDAPPRLQWIGIAFSMTNTGPEVIGIASNGRYAPYVGLVVSGTGEGFPMPYDSALPQLGFYAGVSGCPYPFPGGPVPLAVGATVVGCLAVPVAAESRVASIGFVLGRAIGGDLPTVALWKL